MDKFNTALKQYLSLPHVEYDPMRHTAIGDLAFGAQIQIDLIDEGDLEASKTEYAKLKRFVGRWHE